MAFALFLDPMNFILYMVNHLHQTESSLAARDYALLSFVAF